MNLVKAARQIMCCRAPTITGFSQQKKYCHNSSVSPNLLSELKARIKAVGLLTIADYMKEVLINPATGYYQHKSVFGVTGDFITSPEISQMFGELICVWFLVEWEKIGSPPFQFIELGPGNGTLMHDIMKVLIHFDLHRDISVHLVEVSHRLASVQAKKLSVKLLPGCSKSNTAYQTGMSLSGIPVSWYYHIEDVPHHFSLVVANEFFDALPIHKFERTSEGWKEILIDLNPCDESSLRFIMSRSITPASFFIKPNEKRNHLELSIATASVVEHLSKRIEEDGGIVLVSDYGHDGCEADTFRAFRNHKIHDPLIEPGSADLTADVDFSWIREVAQPKLVTFGPVTQGDFLENLGIKLRLQALLKNCKDNEKSLHEKAYHMLVDKDKMGERFKFFSMFPSVLTDHLRKHPVAGFSQNIKIEEPDL